MQKFPNYQAIIPTLNSLSALLQDSPLYLAVLDETLVCRDITPPWRKYLGRTTTEDVAIPIEQLFTSGTDTLLTDQIAKVVQQGSIIQEIPVSLSRVKSSVQASPEGLLSAWRVVDSSGRQMRVLVIFMETAGHTRTVSKLSQLQITHELILNAVGDGIYGVDCHGNTTFVNEAATQILGWRSEDVLGKSLHDIHHHSYPSATLA